MVHGRLDARPELIIMAKPNEILALLRDGDRIEVPDKAE